MCLLPVAFCGGEAYNVPMKKIGVISDVHGNLPALVTALEYLDKQGCVEIIHTGDVVDIGPNSLECLQLLLERGVTCILGNHDRDFMLGVCKHRHFSHVPEEHKRYVFDTMEGYQSAVQKFPLYVTRNCGGQMILFEHYCRHQEAKDCDSMFCTIEHNPTAQIFDEMYANYTCDAVFFGHKHEPCDIVGKRVYVDVGSLGCHPQPDACGVVIEYDETSWAYRRFALPYDQECVRKKMTDGTLPDGQYLYDFYFAHKKDLKHDF